MKFRRPHSEAQRAGRVAAAIEIRGLRKSEGAGSALFVNAVGTIVEGARALCRRDRHTDDTIMFESTQQ